MPARSAITQLPPTIKAELERRLIAGCFSGYEQLAEWLADQGYPIGKSSIHRFGQGMERKLSAIKASTEAAALIADAAPDDADLRSAAVISLIQTEVFDVLITLQEVDDAKPEERLKLMSRAAKSIAELSRASVNQKKWQVEMRDKVNAAADAVEAIAKKGGLSKEALDTIRRDILGIAA